MGFRKSFIILAAICLTYGVCIFALSGYAVIDDDETKQREAEWLAELQQRQVPIVFYGKVVDLEGQPVRDVDINMSVRTLSGDIYAGDAEGKGTPQEGRPSLVAFAGMIAPKQKFQVRSYR